ncbi:MAG: ABC transporter permease [Firmicutes bacterium]|nr:ABC transporter permease [Bacillota bacterium]
MANNFPAPIPHDWHPSGTADLRATAVSPPVSQWSKNWRQFRRNPLAMFGLVILLSFIVVAILAPAITSFPRGYGQPDELVNPPTGKHWFGTDDLGLDLFAEVVWGSRVTMYVGILATGLALGIGVPIGLAGAFYKGRIDAILTGLTDIFLSLPVLPLMILMAAVMGSTLFNVAIVIGIFSWPQIARVVRGVTLATVEQPFVEAAVAMGSSNAHILWRHLLPNAVPTLVVNAFLTISRAVLSEAGLSFLGLGDPLQWSWGRILQNAQRNGAFVTAWWWAFFPSLAIFLLVISVTFVGTALNEIVNPRLKRR